MLLLVKSPMQSIAATLMSVIAKPAKKTITRCWFLRMINTPAGALIRPEKRMLRICWDEEEVVLSLITPMKMSAMIFAIIAKSGEMSAVTSSGTTAMGTKYGFSFEEKNEITAVAAKITESISISRGWRITSRAKRSM